MLMDVSSEMIHGLLPVYLSVGLGVSMLAIGWIEGAAEALTAITKLFSGSLSDYLGKRKLLAVIGYGMAAFTKPVFPLAASVEWIVGARFVDRIGKGIRGAPRDALITDLTAAAQRGAAFGLRQSLDTVGAFAGPLLAIALMLWSANNFSLVFWIAVVPGFAAFALILFGVKEATGDNGKALPPAPISFSEYRKFSTSFWFVVVIAAVLTLARFSEAFLILRAQNLGLALAFAPLVLVVMNVIYALSAYPAGRLSDRFGRRAPLLSGVIALILSHLLLAQADGLAMLALGILFWGLHMGLTQGLLAALIADTAPEHLRGTGFGIFNLVGGVAILAASVIAGYLWQAYDASVTFYAGAGFAFLALTGLWIRGRYAALAG